MLSIPNSSKLVATIQFT